MDKSNEEAFPGKLPQALAIQKKKLLIAINEADGTAEIISQEDEQVVKSVTEALVKVVPASDTRQSKQWQYSAPDKRIQEMLEKHGVFNLSKYLVCASFVCQTYSTKQCPTSLTISESMQYVLIHARQFGSPTKTIFQTKAPTEQKYVKSEVVALKVTKNSIEAKIIKRTKQLIEDLQQEYDEVKFQALNIQITSFALLIIRRFIKKSERITTYFTLCKCLVIEAYLKSDDAKTKINIRDTCVKYMEWHDMQLPCLFLKVVELYGIKPGDLWDHLTLVKSRKATLSLIDLATEYYNKYQLTKADTTESQRWFAYCRLFGKDYLKTLSNRANVPMCTLLGNLIDRKNEVDEPACKYTCPVDADNVKVWATEIAAELYNKINK